ncbi:peptide ABC transporter substrate-binding protein [Mobilicoccus massiliensis]|uniref:peptide ABC transporter substrate-binding protein n=1 Tax=Mobilicoccus massiliensis TaxID=1522310 RepID=UPI00058EA6CD|nr:ABC transporter substrate-binding protein [Mobilicoccus massiliensis]
MSRHRVGLTAMMALALAGCTSGPTPAPAPSTSHTPQAGDPVVVSTLALPATYDPTDTDDRHATRIAGLLQRGLFRYDPKGKTVPEVATSVETTDNRVFRVTLDPGWQFSNGEPVTADSFVDAWSRAADPAHPKLRRDLFEPIDGFVPSTQIDASHRAAATRPASASAAASSPQPTAASGAATGRSSRLRGLTVLDPHTFTITLSRPHPGFEQRLGHVAFAPLPDLAFTDPAEFGRRPVGNGPYRLDGAWNESGVVRLRPRPGYTAGDPAQNSGLVFRTYTDPAVALSDVEAGRLDVLDTLPTEALPTYKSTFGERAVNQPVGQVGGLVFPITRGPWTGPAGKARRQAISMAIDRDALAARVLAGTRDVATDLAVPLVEGHSQDLCGTVCRLDADTATEALQTGGGLSGGLEIGYAADADQGPVASAICADVTKNLEIPCTGRAYETTRALHEALSSGALTGPALLTRQMDYPLLESFLVPRFTRGALTNDSGYGDPVTDAALRRAATDPAERTTRFQAAEQRILADLPVVPLWNGHAVAVCSTGVRDVRYDVFGSPDYTHITRPRDK